MKTALGKLIICTHVLQKVFPKKDTILYPKVSKFYIPKWLVPEFQAPNICTKFIDGAII